MQQSSEAPWRSQVEFSSLDSYISYDSDMPETDSQSSQEETGSQSSQEETDKLSSQMETDRLSSQMETDRLSSQMETDRLSSQMETDRLSSQMETDRLSSGMKDSPEIKASQAVSVPVPPNTAVGPITRRLSRSLEDVKYVKTFFYKQHIGSETSTMEFKRGLGDPPKSLKINTGEFKGTFVDNLRKYATAFLNNEGGKLMFGVDDSGQVLGNNISFSQQDKYQQTADSVFMNFKPRVWPGNYRVELVPVVAGEEKISPGETPDLKDLMVLEVTFKRPAGCRELYRTEQGKAFIRGNGSVQQMTTDAIHDWYKQKWTDEVEQKTDEVKQLAKENDELRRNQVELAKENDVQKRVIMDLQTKQNSSPTHQKRKMTEPASEEAGKKSPRLENNGSMAVPVMEENEDDEDRKVPVRKGMDDLKDKVPVRRRMDDLKDKTWSEEEKENRASGNTMMKENTVRPMKEKTGRIPSLRSSVGLRGGAENSSVGRPQRQKSDRN